MIKKAMEHARFTVMYKYAAYKARKGNWDYSIKWFGIEPDTDNCTDYE